MVKSVPRTMMEVFKSLPEGTLVQLIENNLVMSPAPTYRHQDILNIINNKIFNFVSKNNLGKVQIASLDVYLDEKNAFQPDIIFISNDNMEIIQKNGLHGAPDLVIELLSPSTAKYDRNEKKDVYERSGVKEYWIVDPESKEVEGYILEGGLYGKPIIDRGKIHSPLLDQEFPF